MAQFKRARPAEPKQSRITCQAVTSLLVDYLDGELVPEAALSLQRHLRDCPDCVAFLRTYKKTVQATRSLRYEDIPARLRERVRRSLRERIKRASVGR